METGKVILSRERFQITLERLCQELIEDYDDFDQTCLVSIQPRGTYLADRIFRLLGRPEMEYGQLDITFYRDDFRTRAKPLKANTTNMPFLVEDKKVILVDDVLYTGRTVQAALTALQHYGRPRRVVLLAMVDRRFNRHLPIQCDYTGLRVDALDEAYVRVDWQEKDGDDRILLFASKTDSQQ